jgi:hypothetical protein
MRTRARNRLEAPARCHSRARPGDEDQLVALVVRREKQWHEVIGHIGAFRRSRALRQDLSNKESEFSQVRRSAGAADPGSALPPFADARMPTEARFG